MKDLGTMYQSALHNGEPVFMLRAKDKAAITAIEAYINKCEELGSPPEHLNEITIILSDFREWQRANETKVPD